MKRIHYDQWLFDLRSGKYEQGFNGLKTPDNKFCVLGVAGNIIDPEAWTSWDATRMKWKGHSICLPNDILPIDIQVHLIDLNDVHEWDFRKLADWIKTNIKPED